MNAIPPRGIRLLISFFAASNFQVWENIQSEWRSIWKRQLWDQTRAGFWKITQWFPVQESQFWINSGFQVSAKKVSTFCQGSLLSFFLPVTFSSEASGPHGGIFLWVWSHPCELEAVTCMAYLICLSSILWWCTVTCLWFRVLWI